MKKLRNLCAILAMASATATLAVPMDEQNPTCPQSPNWSTNRTMELTAIERGGQKILLAEGRVDQGLPGRLQRTLEENPEITEIWFRSPGGDALSGNDAGRLLRTMYPGIVTRIPSGWTCFSACNFVFMGGQLRIIEPGGIFMVHMFTHSGDRAVRENLASGGETAAQTIGAIEQSSAQLATEDNDFLLRMGISRRLLSEVMYETSAVGQGEIRRCLSQEESYEFNVANVRE